MGKSFIMTVNNASQNVLADGDISLGSVARRFGCNMNLVGNALNIVGEGYYQLTASVTVAPAEIGAVTLTVYDNGVALPGATATQTVAAADDVTTLTVPTAVRIRCGCCEGEHNITCRLSVGGEVTNTAIIGDRK